MASSMMVSSTATMSRATPAQSSMVTPFTGLKSTSAFPATRKANTDLTNLPSNGGKVQCMKVWPIEGVKKFETLSYLPTLPVEALLKQVEYLLKNNWVPCLEFCKVGFVYRENHFSPGYYDGRYWTMWKLPMFGCNDAAQVVNEIGECAKEYPDAFIRVIGFDNKRQVQCISFVAFKPEQGQSYTGAGGDGRPRWTDVMFAHRPPLGQRYVGGRGNGGPPLIDNMFIA